MQDKKFRGFWDDLADSLYWAMEGAGNACGALFGGLVAILEGIFQG